MKVTNPSREKEPQEARFYMGICGLFLLSLGYWACLFRHQLPGMTDTLMHAYPDKIFNQSQFRQGIIPLWNSMIGCGIPQVANWQSACFYPFSRALDAFNVAQTFMLLAFFHQALAFAGGCLWLRSRKISFLGSSLGALCFSSSALFVRSCAVPHPQAALTWIPWIFWSTALALEKPSLPRWILAVLFMILQILAGYPLFVFYTFLLLALWALFQKPSFKAMGGLGLAFLTALAATALQWLPFLEFLTYAQRGGWWKEFPFFNKPAEYLTLLRPDILGTPGDSCYQGSIPNYFFNLYFGIIPLAALVSDWLFSRTRKSFFNFWNMSFLFFLSWMAGTHFPPLRIFPGKILELFEPSKADALFIFCASTAAAFAANRWISRFKNRQAQPWILLFALAWTLNLLWVPFQLVHPIPNPYEDKYLSESAEKIKGIAGTGRVLSLSLEQQLTFQGNDWIEKAMKTPVQKLLVDANEAWGIRSTSLYLSIVPQSVNNLCRYANKGFPYEGGLLDLAGIRLFILPQALPAPSYQGLGKWGEQVLSLNPRAAPDLRWVPASVFLPDSASILNLLSRPGISWKKKVYLERKSGQSPLELLPASYRLPSSSGSQRTSCRISDLLDCPSEGFVVFNETCAPGWHAWVDGIPVPLFRAYGLFMAVNLPLKGIHQVDFRYEPTSFRLGLFLTLLTAALFTAGTLKSYSRSGFI